MYAMIPANYHIVPFDLLPCRLARISVYDNYSKYRL